MFKRLLQASSAQDRETVSADERNTQAGQPTPALTERNRIDSTPKSALTKLLCFDDIYQKSSLKTPTGTAEYTILKVADMVNSDHLRGLSPAAKHNAVLMALEAAGVAVEAILQDAMQRQHVLNEYEDAQRRRMQDFETVKLSENERLAGEMEAVCAQYRARIAAGVEEIEREREIFREWQERKGREQRRIAEAASCCVSDDAASSSDVSVTRLLEKNAGRLRESA